MGFNIGNVLSGVLSSISTARNPNGDLSVNVAGFKIDVPHNISTFIEGVGGEAKKIGSWLSALGVTLDPPMQPGGTDASGSAGNTKKTIDNLVGGAKGATGAAGDDDGIQDDASGDMELMLLKIFSKLEQKLEGQAGDLAKKIDASDKPSQMDMLKLQDLMGKRAQLFTTMSDILKNQHDTQMGIARNIV
jgi:hypothetical protein